MASGQTMNYQLNQWEASDKVLRTEFNADNAKIDGALAALAGLVAGKADKTALEETAAAVPKIAVGTYSGNGAASQAISLGFAPTVVLACTQEGAMYASGYVYGGLALSGSPALRHYHYYTNEPYVDYPAVEVTSTGFRVYETAISDYAAIHCNQSGYQYHYLAVG